MNVKNADLEKVAKINYPFNGPETYSIIEEDSKSGHQVVSRWLPSKSIKTWTVSSLSILKLVLVVLYGTETHMK